MADDSAATVITDLDVTFPEDDALANVFDEQLRMLKVVCQTVFPVYDGAVTATAEQMNTWLARIDALEAQGTTEVIPPVAGHISLTSATTYTVTGVGFEPRHIKVMGSSNFNDGLSESAVMSITNVFDVTLAAAEALGSLIRSPTGGSGNPLASFTAKDTVSTPDFYIPQTGVGLTVFGRVASLTSDGFTFDLDQHDPAADYDLIWIAYP